MKQTITLTITIRHNRPFAIPSTGLWRAVDAWAAEERLDAPGIGSTNVTDDPEMPAAPADVDRSAIDEHFYS